MADLREDSTDGSVSSEAFLGGPDSPPLIDDDQVIDVWWDLVWPVEVFIACRLDFVASMGGTFCNGLSSLEVEAACRILQVPADIVNDVAIEALQAGKIARELINSRR